MSWSFALWIVDCWASGVCCMQAVCTHAAQKRVASLKETRSTEEPLKRFPLVKCLDATFNAICILESLDHAKCFRGWLRFRFGDA